MPDGLERVVEGSVEGMILLELRGQEGFGYDPLFFVPEYQATLAELPLAIKNQISHRGRAFQKIVVEIKNILQKQ
jgi:XTP/dITP diphosphohydrolase